jgi:L-asparaginase / beta-aspartyl-peptidase
MMKLLLLISLGIIIALATSCTDTGTDADSPNQENEISPEPRGFAIVIHGGAGVISRDLPQEVRDTYIRSLTEALSLGRDLLNEGEPGLDVAERVVRFMEDDSLFNAGRGAVLTNAGTVELDASIMDGRDLSAGAVTGVRTVKNPVSLARKVMENTPHILLAGDGAESYADETGVERVDNSYFITERRRNQLEQAIERNEVRSGHDGNSTSGLLLTDFDKMGTVGVVVRDKEGNLAAATSTGGMTNKRFGRVGDSPIIGAGTYADNRTCAISGTGTGEEFMRNAVAYQISAIMELTGATLQEAAEIVVHEKLKEGDGGIIGVSHDGSVAMVFNSPGMFRGAADSRGLFEVKIWE